MPYPWECIDCTWLDEKDCKYGECYCRYNHYYVKADSPSCRHLNKKTSSSNCYLTTIMCNILEYEDDCYILNRLRDFRDNYMKENEEYKPLLEDYDIIGPEVCKLIEKDDNKIEIAKVMLNGFINPAIKNINSGNNEIAIEIYKNMTISLMKYYDLDPNTLNCVKNRNYQKVRK